MLASRLLLKPYPKADGIIPAISLLGYLCVGSEAANYCQCRARSTQSPDSEVSSATATTARGKHIDIVAKNTEQDQRRPGPHTCDRRRDRRGIERVELDIVASKKDDERQTLS